MKIESLTCPNCGHPLTLPEELSKREIVFCPACGSQLHVDLNKPAENNEPPKDPRITVKDEATGNPIAQVLLPPGWTCKGMVIPVYQSIDKPFQPTVLARSDDGASTIFIRNGEVYMDVIEQFDKMAGTDKFVHGKMARTHPNKMIHRMPTAEYMDHAANGLFKGFKVTPVAQAKLPSVFGMCPDALKKVLRGKFEFQQSWENMYPNPPSVASLVSVNCESVLRKYESESHVHLLGADMGFVETEITSSSGALAYGMVGMLAMAMNNTKGRHCYWGSEILFSCTTDKAHEAQATAAFMQMVSSFAFDPCMYKLKYEKADQWNREQMSIYNATQQQVAINQANLRANQARLQQTLAENSRATSDMIMDTWNKKMASDSRMSQARHEATMGVNTYVRTDGTRVEHSVVSDHVYQNKYGDTIGVSGPAFDPGDIPDWTEIPRA